MNETGLYLKIKDIVWLTAVVLGAVYVFGDKMTTGIPQFDATQRYIVYILVVDSIYMIMSCSGFFNRSNALFISIFACFIAGVAYACYRNAGTVPGRNPLAFAKYDLIAFSCIFISIIYTAQNKKLEQLLKIVTCVIAAFCLINDMFMLIGYQFGATAGGVNYFVGTKFTVAYLHMSLIVAYTLISANSTSRNRRAIIAFLVVLSIAVSIRSDCNTGIIGIVLLAFMILGNEYSKGIRNLLYTRPFFVFSLFYGLIFAALVTIILANPFVQHIIVDVLDRELTLTGRTDIYAYLFLALANSILFGYGYGNSYTISKNFFGYANTQNGLAEWLLQVGIIGAIPMVLLFFYCIFSIISTDKEKEMMPVVAMLYVFNFLASVEVTISIIYFYWIFVLLAWAGEKKNEKEKI